VWTQTSSLNQGYKLVVWTQTSSLNQGYKLVVWTQASSLNQMMRTCKCFSHVDKMSTLTYNYAEQSCYEEHSNLELCDTQI
jgi:hypothetical protein